MEILVEAKGIADHDRLLVITKVAGDPNLHELLHGSKAAGQDEKAVGEILEHRFARSHRFSNEEFSRLFIGKLFTNELMWNNTEGLAADASGSA